MIKKIAFACAIMFILAGCSKNYAAPLLSVSLPSLSDLQPKEPQAVIIALQNAKESNEDVTGWLRVNETEINSPVMQTEDNEYYLRRNFSHEYDVWGSYFADYECNVSSAQELNRSTIIYGHSYKDTTEAPNFSQIKFYADEEFAKTYPNVFFTPYGEEEEVSWQVFAAGVVPVTLEYLYPSPNNENFLSMITTFREASVQAFADVEVGLNDKILILSTCTSDSNTRFVLVAKLVGA